MSTLLVTDNCLIDPKNVDNGYLVQEERRSYLEANGGEFPLKDEDRECLVDKILNKRLSDLVAKDGKDGLFLFPSSFFEDLDEKANPCILRSDGDKYRTGNLMGFLGYREERLIIRSRFCCKGDNGESKRVVVTPSENEQQDYFLQYLLQKVNHFPQMLDLPVNSNTDNPLFDFLLYIFPHYLREAMRKGLYRTYVKRQYNDARFKGQLDLARHIKLNTPFVGKVAYNQRELTADNNLIQLVRHTIEYIKSRRCGNAVLSRVKDEVGQVVDATPSYQRNDRQKIIAKNLGKPVNHPYYREFLQLQRLCLYILQHRRVWITGSPHKLYGILFDGSWLWEEYLNTLIGDAFYHPRNKARTGGQHFFKDEVVVKDKDGRIRGLIYPDFIGKKKGDRIIADAKYKPIDNIAGDDYGQILSYMFRFDSKQGYFLYPAAQKEDPVTYHLLQGVEGFREEGGADKRTDSPPITVTKLGLVIPNSANSYEGFVQAMVANERAFVAQIPGLA